MDEPSRDSPLGPPEDSISEADAADPVASALPQTPVKCPKKSASDERASTATRSRRDPSPRRIVLTKPKRTIPALKIIQSSPVDTFSPVASSTPAKPLAGKVAKESPLLGKRRYDETIASPGGPTKPKSKGKGIPVDPAPVHTSPIESPRFNISTPTRTNKRPRESGRSPSPQPKRKTLRSSVIPTSPVNSATFPPNTELPPISNRQGSLTVSSGQFRRPRDDEVVKIKSRPPPAGDTVANTSVIESFDTSPPKRPTTVKKAGPADNRKRPQVTVETTAAETSLLTSPGTSPEKPSTFAPPAPLQNAPQRPPAKNVVDPTVMNLTSQENPREESAPNPRNVTEPNPPPPGQTAKRIGITKLRPATTTIPQVEAGPSKTSSGTMPLRNQPTLAQLKVKRNPPIPVKGAGNKPPKMMPVEYAEMLVEKFSNPNRKIPNVSQHLRGRKIFYASVDTRYAGDGTKRKMEYVRTLTTPNSSLAADHPVPDSQARGHACP